MSDAVDDHRTMDAERIVMGCPGPGHDEECEAEWVTGPWGGGWSICGCKKRREQQALDSMAEPRSPLTAAEMPISRQTVKLGGGESIFTPEQAADIRHKNHQRIIEEIFHERILAWLKHYRPWLNATGVKEVRGNGTDWSGSTEDGYRSNFDLDIKYTTDKGDTWTDVDGEDLQSLWDCVVGGRRPGE